MAKISAAGGPTVAGVPGLDNQSDREEDQFDPGEGGTPSVADRIELASQAGGDQPADQGADQDQPDKSDIDAEADDEADDYSQMTYGDVQALCKNRGLPATGSHSELVARLEASDRRM